MDRRGIFYVGVVVPDQTDEGLEWGHGSCHRPYVGDDGKLSIYLSVEDFIKTK